jgi:hypothetical protein
MIRSGKFYKVGKTNAAGRRERELAIQLPERTSTVHIIKTDDPAGIEAYWHKRFEAKRRHSTRTQPRCCGWCQGRHKMAVTWLRTAGAVSRPKRTAPRSR